jgi:hypothetical protein
MKNAEMKDQKINNLSVKFLFFALNSAKELLRNNMDKIMNRQGENNSIRHENRR